MPSNSGPTAKVVPPGPVAVMPGTCGELFQGTIDGQPCLVSLPIDRWVRTRIQRHPEGSEWCLPAGRSKTRTALKLAARHWRIKGAGELFWRSQLPESKGYGSSTADIGAALHAMAAAAEREVSGWQVVQMATAIEPTDSSPLPGLALLDHREGRWHQKLGKMPELLVLVVDTGGMIDTLAFNQVDYRRIAREYGSQHELIYARLSKGIRLGDPQLIGWAATMSARIQQGILPKPAFRQLLELSEETGALGLNVAHSGTLVGLLYSPESIDQSAVMEYAAGCLPRHFEIGWQQTVQGGVRWSMSEGVGPTSQEVGLIHSWR